MGAALDHAQLDLPHLGHLDGVLLGLLRTRMGWLVVLGSGGERQLHALACRHRSPPFRTGHGDAQCTQDLDHFPVHRDLLALAAGYLPCQVGHSHVRAYLRQRSDTRPRHPGPSRSPDRRRLPAVRDQGKRPAARRALCPISREGALILNNLFLATSVGAVLVGTLYPLLLDAIAGTSISVGAPFFDLTFGSLMAPLLLVLPFGPLLPWKRADLVAVGQRLAALFLIALVLAISISAIAGVSLSLVPIGLFLGFWATIGSLAEVIERSRIGRISLGESFRRIAGLPRTVWSTASRAAAQRIDHELLEICMLISAEK